MTKLLEVHQDQFTISTDPARLDMDAIVNMLQRAYWATGRPRERTERAIRNTLVFGVYDGERQIGIARVVTDFSIFAYLCDVFILENYRARGLGKWLISTSRSRGFHWCQGHVVYHENGGDFDQAGLFRHPGQGASAAA